MSDDPKHLPQHGLGRGDRAQAGLEQTEGVQDYRIPEQASPMVGRAEDLERATELLLNPETRLMTLVGAAGVGKTRLAIAVAARVSDAFGDGVRYVDLSEIRSSSDWLPLIARSLGLPELPEPLFDAVLRRAASCRCLLVLDNFDHVQDATRQLGALLSDPRTNALKIIVTSRERLHLSWERLYQVEPLATPSEGGGNAATVMQSPAVILLTQFARAHRPEFQVTDRNAGAVAKICQRLEGLPLALALAAPQLGWMEPDELASRLGSSLSELSNSMRDAPERHRTMRAAIAWSYKLLDSRHQQVFREISVFVGGFSVDLASEVVCSETILEGRTGESALARKADISRVVATLFDKSLVQREPSRGAETRFRMLEPIGEFAEEQLGAHGESERVRARFAQYFVALAAQTEPRLSGGRQIEWLNAIEVEYVNLRAVLHWLLDRADAETGVRLVAALWRFWYLHSHYREGRYWLESFVTLPTPAQVDPLIRATALNGLGSLAYSQGDLASAYNWHKDSLALRRTHGDEQGVAGSLNNLGLVLRARGRLAHAADLFGAALRQNTRLGNRNWIAINLNNLGNVDRDATRWKDALDRQRESLALFTSLEDAWGQGMAQCDMALVHLDLKEVEIAAAELARSLETRSAVGDRRGVGLALLGLARADIAQSRLASGHEQLVAGLEIFIALGDTLGIAHSLECLAVHAAAAHDYDRAAKFITWAQRLRQNAGAPRSPNDHRILAQFVPEGVIRQAISSAPDTDASLDMDRLVAYARNVQPEIRGEPLLRDADSAEDDRAGPTSLQAKGRDAPKPGAQPIRLVIIDDEAAYREGLQVMLARLTDQMVICGEAAHCQAALEVVKEHHPDVVLLDLKLPLRAGIDQRPLVAYGIETIRAIRVAVPEAHILVLSHQDERPMDVLEAIRAGALGYLSKRDVEHSRDLLGPIVSVKNGQAFFGPAIAELIQRYFALGMGPEPTHEELDDLESVAREGPGATVGTIVAKLQSGGGDIARLSTLTPPTRTPINVFVSYAHADEAYKRALLNHLAILARLGVIKNWHDGRIEPGAEWRTEVERELALAQIVLLLISADFLSSDFCWGVEMQTALTRHDAGEVQIIPVIVRECDWQESPIGKLQVLPTDGRAIATWEDRDAALTNVARGIRNAASRADARMES